MPKDNFVLVSIPIDELQTLIIDSVNACLKFHYFKVQGQERLPELMTRKQVADYLQISTATVDVLSRSGVLKKYYMGTLVRFKREEVREAKYNWKNLEPRL